VTVALSGDGGDEAFAGYERYIAHGLAARIPAPAARIGAAALRTFPATRGEPRSPLRRTARLLDVAAGDPRDRYARLMEVFPLPLRRALWTEAARARPTQLEPVRDGLAGLQLLDVATYLPGDLLLKADIATMAHSLELRSPFLDHEVVALGLALPDYPRWSNRFKVSTPTFRCPYRSSANAEAARATSVSGGSRSLMNRSSQRSAACS